MGQECKWLQRPRIILRPRVRLFCFPFAGGSASAYRDWHRWLPDDIELCAVQLAGRETRFSEPLQTCLHKLVDQLFEELHPFFASAPFVFFGHSMGALLAYFTARRVFHEMRLEPEHLHVSARSAPHMPQKNRMATLPEEELVSQLRKVGEIPESILQQPLARKLFLRTLRADFELSETFQYREEPPFNCPISAYGGQDDPLVSAEDLAKWQIHTCRDFQVNLFPGGHSYLRPCGSELIVRIVAQLPAMDCSR